MKTVISILFLATTAFFFAQNVQVVNISEVKFNGKLKLFATKKEYLQIMGKPTTTKRDFPGCSNYDEVAQKGTPSYIYHKNGTKYLVYGNHADFEEMALENHPDSFLMIGKHKISEKTTLQDLKSMFPIEYNNYKRGDDYIFRLKFNADWDDELQIGIENGKASGIYYWAPC